MCLWYSDIAIVPKILLGLHTRTVKMAVPCVTFMVYNTIDFQQHNCVQ